MTSDTASFYDEAMFEPGGYQDANVAILMANTIDVPNSTVYKFWSRNPANSDWVPRSEEPDAILATRC